MSKSRLSVINEHIDLRMLIASVLAMLIFFMGLKALAGGAIIKIDGSSTVFPITEAMAEEFQTAEKGATKVTVGISGTGGGFKKFCRGETDIQDASRPIQASEMEVCKQAGIKYLELPVAYDAIAIVVNPKAKWLEEITVEELKKMWSPEAQGKITKWNQVNPKWPDAPIKLFGPGTDSGTFDYFTEAIVGKSKSSRGDYTASEDDNVIVQGVSQDINSLGYFGLAYYESNKSKLKALKIVGGEKSPQKNKGVLPTKETVENSSYFPLSRPIFIYINEASLKKSEVKRFTEFYINNATTLVPSVKYVALPKKIYDLALKHVNTNKLGTVFGGHSEVGLKIDELMKKEGKL